MNAPLKLATSGIAALVAAALTACHAGYDVEVRNLADQPVTARLVTGHVDGAGFTLRESFIGPGDNSALFVQRDENETVSLSVDFAGNVGQPATLGLAKGKTTVIVRRADEGSRGRIKLEIQP